MAGWFGPGPFNNGEPFAGYLNGRYMGVVTGNNISGVLGFAIVDGAPAFRQDSQGGGQQQQQALQPGQDRQPAAIRPDVLQNYFAIFVEGRVYSGVTFAGINIDNNTVSGALQGENPSALQNFTAQSPIPQLSVTTDVFPGPPPVLVNSTNFPPLINLALDALPIVNRGLSGGFTATINSKNATFTYSGRGQLSTPANRQTVTMSGLAQTPNPLVPPFLIPPTLLTNEVISASVQTETTPFNIRGIRTSFSAVNQAAAVDQLQLQQGQQQ